ncbi:hypothetical protein ACWDR0_03105 [Streptomyces sp. NPDC003691]
MPVEIEMRARYSPQTHDRLLGRLRCDAEDLGPDDKSIHFYVLPDQLLKVTENTSAGTAKVSLKNNRIGRGAAFGETEFAIAPADVATAVRLLDALSFGGTRHEAFTRRHNFRLDGVEIAVKWSEAWGHHAEFEVLLDDDAPGAARTAAAERIAGVAAALGVVLMTEEELAEFTAAFEAREQERKESERWSAGT